MDKYNSRNRDDHRYSRKEIIQIIGATETDRVSGKNCEPTNVLLADNDDRTEWSASINTTGSDGDSISVTAVYYTTPQDAEIVDANGGDWGGVDWDIDHYTILTQ